MDQVIQYILQEYHRGVHPEQIRQVLLRQGFSDQRISSAFQQAFSTYGVQNVNDRLEKYISSELQHGFSRQQISRALISSGYSESDIALAFDSLNPQGGKKRRALLPGKRSFIVISALTISIIAISLSMYFVMLQEDSDEDESEIILKLVEHPQKISSTEVITFSVRANVKGSGRVSGNLETKVYPKDNFRVVASQSQPAAAGINDVQVPLPKSVSTGQYQVVSTMRTSMPVNQVSFMIDIAGKPIPLNQTSKPKPNTTSVEEEVYIDYYDTDSPFYGEKQGHNIVRMS